MIYDSQKRIWWGKLLKETPSENIKKNSDFNFGITVQNINCYTLVKMLGDDNVKFTLLDEYRMK